jgi:chloride channel protein, CIC family
VARRGYHLSREYAVDPLEILFVRDVMRTNVVVLPATSSIAAVQHSLRADYRQTQRLLPVVDRDRRLVGVLTRGDIRDLAAKEADVWRPIEEVVRPESVETYPDEPLRMVVYRMAEKGLTRMPVVKRETGQFLGLVSLDDLLKARARHLEEERRRERTINLKFLSPGGKVGREEDSVHVG